MSSLFIMRHGEAAPGFPDSKRLLTPQGEHEVAMMAQWLAARLAKGEFFSPVLYASPYARAQQTARIVAEALGCSLSTLDFITPEDDPAKVSDWLLTQPDSTPIMLVSHMPLVGNLTELLVEGRAGQGLGFATAGIAELEADVWAAGCAQLMRYMSPRQLA
ncbi:phosphohistidine phosphatase SixA [Halomonas citrativorans]|uniref:Phosphohistidine phosphatase SixA n=1 Tax=Halomonas citrativorans TaxID=2742612 RepID=A0ABR9F8E7_9GAMM|nr:phosphohistidine phosphatase SixA [Halomonas citrativorans]MBE0402022.1 phosphohistidine phosphatase SixA [Halomonas citrativorans]